MATVPTAWRRRVRAIDADLDLVWLNHEEKFAVTQRLYNTPSIEAMTTHVVRELREQFRAAGYTHLPAGLEAVVYAQVAASQIVCRVENEDGSFRPVDERVLTKLRRMAWKRRHYGAKDYAAAMNAASADATRARERANESMWQSIKRDKVFARVATDVFAGLRPARSVNVPARPTAEGECT